MNTKSKRTGLTKFNEQPISPVDALVRKLDLVALDMETRWGAGVLHSLCTPETSAKFMRVKEALDEAIRGGDYDTVKAKSESLIRGWQKMESEAIEAGHKIGHVTDIWFCCSPNSGIEYIFCKNELDSSRMAAQYPSRVSAIYTFADIARMIEAGSVVNIAGPRKQEVLTKVKSWSEELLSDEVPW